MTKKIKIGSMYIDVTSAIVGAVAVAVLSVVPVVGGYVTGAFNWIRSTVSGLFNKQ